MKGRILVVDDEDYMRSICARVLRAAGCEVFLAGTLEEALEMIKGLDGLQLLVTDLQLPDGHGCEAVRGFRGKFPEAGVLVITAFPDLDARREEFLGLGVTESDVLAKPFELGRLEAAVRARLPGGEEPGEGE